MDKIKDVCNLDKIKDFYFFKNDEEKTVSDFHDFISDINVLFRRNEDGSILLKQGFRDFKLKKGFYLIRDENEIITCMESFCFESIFDIN